MSIDTSKGHQAMDYPQHVDTYKAFLRLTTLTTVGCVVLLILMAYVLV